MRTAFLLTICTLLLLLVGCNDNGKETAKTLSIATFNTYFLWDGIEPEEGNSNISFPHKGNAELAREHMSQIADIIRELNADIVNLVEIEGLDALEMLTDTFLSDMKYEIGFVKGKDTFTGQDVAILSKYPIVSIERFENKGESEGKEKSVSKNYIADIEINGKTISFIGIHLLARPMDASRLPNRQAQAAAIRVNAIERFRKGNQVVVFGDLNDFDGDTSCLDINSNTPITNVLKVLKIMDSTSINDDLRNIFSLVAKENRYTAHWDQDGESDVDKDELSAIDHILLSQDLFNSIKNVEVIHSYNPFEVSDHFPVLVKIEL